MARAGLKSSGAQIANRWRDRVGPATYGRAPELCRSVSVGLRSHCRISHDGQDETCAQETRLRLDARKRRARAQAVAGNSASHARTLYTHATPNDQGGHTRSGDAEVEAHHRAAHSTVQTRNLIGFGDVHEPYRRCSTA